MSTHGAGGSVVAERTRRYTNATPQPKQPTLTKNGKRVGRPPNPETGVRRQFATLTSKMNDAQDRADELRRASGAAHRAGNTALRDQLMQRAERAQDRYRALRSVALPSITHHPNSEAISP